VGNWAAEWREAGARRGLQREGGRRQEEKKRRRRQKKKRREKALKGRPLHTSFSSHYAGAATDG
jgi:hypothetical protein